MGVHGPHHPPRVPPAQGFRSLPSNVFGSKVEGGFHFYSPCMHVFSQFDIKTNNKITHAYLNYADRVCNRFSGFVG